MYTWAQYTRHTRTYKQYTHVNWVQEIHVRIKNIKENISSIYAV